MLRAPKPVGRHRLTEQPEDSYIYHALGILIHKMKACTIDT